MSQIDKIHFDSIGKFYDYITTKPLNSVWQKKRWQSSNDRSRPEFHGTANFQEAVDLLRNGWTDMAEELTKRISAIERQTAPVTKRRTTIGVVGYQPIVPLYLAGVPMSMASTTMVPVKQKIITITKMFSYSYQVTQETIVQESAKTLAVIKKVEAQGYRVNLNVGWCTRTAAGHIVAMTVRLKNAGEKLNVAKLAFPLVHPSMLRRLMFRWLEVYPLATEGFARAYGYPSSKLYASQVAAPGEVVLMEFLQDEAKLIEDMKYGSAR